MMSRKVEHQVIRGFWVVALIFATVGTISRNLWLVGGGVTMFMYLLWYDKNTVEELVARDDLRKSIKDLERVIKDIEREG